jgi:prepilin peptidase CpaA
MFCASSGVPEMSETILLWVPVIICGIAVFHDLRSREIPNWLPLIILLLVPAHLVTTSSGSIWWQHISGGLVALIAGMMVGHKDRFGGGDIKLFAALGTWFGILSVVPLALWIAIAGLPLAIAAAMRKQSDFAYAPAIFIGVCVHVAAPDLLSRIAS